MGKLGVEVTFMAAEICKGIMQFRGRNKLLKWMRGRRRVEVERAEPKFKKYKGAFQLVYILVSENLL